MVWKRARPSVVRDQNLYSVVIAMEVIHVSQKPLRILKPCREINNNLEQVNSVKKCLFGSPDIKDVENLLEEQLKEDWARIRRDFGIDLQDIENMENARMDARTPKKRKVDVSSRRSVRRRRLFQHDRKMTDFYQVRKNVPNEKKES